MIGNPGDLVSPERWSSGYPRPPPPASGKGSEVAWQAWFAFRSDVLPRCFRRSCIISWYRLTPSKSRLRMSSGDIS